MQRAYTPEWRPPQPSPDDFNSRYHYKGSRDAGGDASPRQGEDKHDDDDDDDHHHHHEEEEKEEEEEEEEEEDDDEAGPLPVCTTDDELDFEAMGAPTVSQPVQSLPHS